MATLTKGLQNLREQVNSAFPGRDTASDGWIGDPAHQTRTSGHNADDTAGSKPSWSGDPDTAAEVRAWDCDADLGQGVAMQTVVDHIRRLPNLGSVLRYMIFNRKMYHVDDGFQPTSYTGDNPHDKHCHFEGGHSQSADSNTTYEYRLGEIPVALTEADKDWIAQEIRNAILHMVKNHEECRDQLRALPWQYKKGGLNGAETSLEALADAGKFARESMEIESGS